MNASNMKTLDLSALQDPGHFKDKIPANLSQSNYTGWSPKGLPRPKTSSTMAPCEAFSPYYTVNVPLFAPYPFDNRPGIFADIDQFHHIADDQFDQEFALFLRSVKPTLQRLDYEIGHPFGIEQTDIESPPRRA